jgi:hypothetical protein
VSPVLEVLSGVEQLLHLLPIVPNLREQFSVRKGQTVQREALDVLVELLKPHRIDVRTLAASRNGGIGSIKQQPPA